MIKAEILLDSIGANGSAPRLTTWVLTLPRFILAELNTHRMFSRNYPSSRAIPVLKRMGMVISEPVIPIEWGLDRPGMQAKETATGLRKWMAKTTWRLASFGAVAAAWVLVKLGIHKQIANRLLEPFVTVTGLVTATQAGWENFFALRAEDAADPHIQALAYEMLEKYNESIPKTLEPGDWHIPYGDKMEDWRPWNEKVKVAVARAARVSYNSFDGANDIEKDFILHDRLAESGHWSAFEHIAQVPVRYSGDPIPNPAITKLYGNLPGWIQLRKTYPNECRKDSRVK
jgi:thymidylate synthase ThyX